MQFTTIYPDLSLLEDSAKNETNLGLSHRDVATCVCDVTANLCDYLCCCDPDCSTEERVEWYKTQT